MNLTQKKSDPLQCVRVMTGLLVYLLLSPTTPGQQNEASARPVATHLHLQLATVRIDGSNDRSSGVVISEDGLILTVAHGLAAKKRSVRVVFHDGTTGRASVIQRLENADVALLQLSNLGAKALPFLSARRPETQQSLRHQAALASGFPAREENGLSPVLRLGTIIAVGKTSLRSTCTLTAGDSGGPLVDRSGRLIGIHQKIGLGPASNLHLKIETCLSALKASSADAARAVSIGRSTSGVSEFGSTDRSPRVAEVSRCLSVSILQDGSGTPKRFGTIVGPATVVSKLSSIDVQSRLIVVLADGSEIPCGLHAMSRPLDLAVLRLEKEVPPTVAMCVNSVAIGNAKQFDVVYGGNVTSPGIVARVGYHEPSARASLGFELRSNSGQKMIVTRISPDSAAADAGMQIQDQVETLNAIPLRSFNDVGRALSTFEPGDLVDFGIRRNGVSMLRVGRLRHDAVLLLDRAVFLDGRSGELSERRTGLKGMIQHDAALAAPEMGTPLLDFEGRLVGVNIARRSRESVLAIPIDVISGWVQSLDVK